MKMNPKMVLEKLKGLRTNRKLMIGAGAGIGAVLVLAVGVKVGMSTKSHPEATAAHGSNGKDHAKAEHGKSGHGNSEHAKDGHAKDGHAKDEHAKDGHAKAEHVKAEPGILSMHTLNEAMKSVAEKARELARADEENTRLKLENANLRLKLESMKFDCHAQDAQAQTQANELKLDKQTGSRLGRTLASIGYKMPSHLLPNQLYTLAVSYFKAREDEKAAVILTFLTGMENDDSYRSAKNLLMTGIAWYRVDNLAIADEYFEKALKSDDIHENRGQALLWKALAAERLGKHGKSQEWLREVLNLNPHSTEAAWINHPDRTRRKEASRATASAAHH